MKAVLFLVFSVALVLVSSENVKVTLDDGPSRSSGRVEITLEDGELRQVCAADFESEDTDALCQAAGFTGSKASTDDFGTKGGLEYVKVECSSGTCEYTRQPNSYVCTSNALGLDCSPNLGVTGSIGLEAGIIAGILVTIVAVVGIVLGLSVCLYRNDLVPCLQNTAA